VILGSGLASDNHDWGLVEDRVSEYTQVCSYDRSGLGQSESTEGSRTAQTASNELNALVTGAGIKGQVVMAGHSYGGLVAQLYAARHHENTAGVVLVDSLQKDNLARSDEILGDQAMALFMQGVQNNPEGVDLEASFSQAAEIDDLGDLPLTVITAGRPDLPPFINAEIREQLADSWLESQQDLVRLSSVGLHVVAEESGHCVQCEQPKLVADAILREVSRARNRYGSR
jgi:pimeloyl-ACP methyl ester carboxylesterase